MGRQFKELADKHVQFIGRQKMFFVGTAMATGRVNISPKGMDSLRVLDSTRVVWLNATGSGNESAAHVQHTSRMTILFCAFDGKPLILRLYGSARVIHRGDCEWKALFPLFKPLPGARQIFDLSVDLVQTSCGMAVPYLSYEGDRELLNDWATRKGNEGLQRYWEEKNQSTIDGVPTNIIEKTLIDNR